MIIYRAFTREAVRNTLAITLVLSIVMSFIGLTVLLGKAVRGDLADDILFRLLGLEMLRRLDLLLTLGVFLGVLMTAGRWYRDSEMTVLAACGIGLTQILRPTLVFTLFIALVVSALGFYFTPWALGRMEVVKRERERQMELTAVAPGVFNDTPSGKVFYAERVNRQSGVLGYVFVSGLEQGKEGVVAARSGYPRTDERTGDRFMVLVDGNLYEGGPGNPSYRMVQFEALHVRLESKPFVEPPPKVEATPTIELFGQDDPEARVEWHWRISKPLTSVVLVIFALVLAYTDPRRGRLSNLFMAILVYVIYSNMLALGQTMLKNGQIPWSVGLLWVHAVMFVFAMYFFLRRAANRPLFALPDRKT